MKKILLLFSFLFLILFNTQAQNTFAPIGAEWHYASAEKYYNYWAGYFYPDFTWNDRMVSKGDTIIMGQTCNILEITRTRKSGLDHSISTQSPSYQYVYSNNDTTFYFDKDSSMFYPLYIWSAHDGDTLDLPQLNKRAPRYHLLVDSVRIRVYDTFHLKAYYTTSFVDTTYTPFDILNWGNIIDLNDAGVPNFVQQSHGGYIEKLGGFRGLFPSFTATNPDVSNEILSPAGPLICYHDSLMNMQSMAFPSCDFLYEPFYTSLDDISYSKLKVSIAPNPASTQINIESQLAFESNSQLMVTDILGRMMMAPLQLDKKKNANVDVSKWANGIYLLKFQLGAYAYYQKISVQH